MFENLRMNKKAVLLLTIAVFAGAVGMLRVLNNNNSHTIEKAAVRAIREVEAQTLQRGPQMVSVHAYGSVVGEKVVTLQAPFKGTVRQSERLFPGKFIPAGVAFYLFDTSEIDIMIAQKEVQLETLEIKGATLAAER